MNKFKRILSFLVLNSDYLSSVILALLISVPLYIILDFHLFSQMAGYITILIVPMIYRLVTNWDYIIKGCPQLF